MAKADIIKKEIIEGTFDGYVVDTIDCIDEQMQKVKEMGYEEFLCYLLYENKGEYMLNENPELFLYKLVENVVPSFQIFVDRGYERHTA